MSNARSRRTEGKINRKGCNEPSLFHLLFFFARPWCTARKINVKADRSYFRSANLCLVDKMTRVHISHRRPHPKSLVIILVLRSWMDRPLSLRTWGRMVNYVIFARAPPVVHAQLWMPGSSYFGEFNQLRGQYANWLTIYQRNKQSRGGCIRRGALSTLGATMPYFRLVAHTFESSVFRSNLTLLLPDPTQRDLCAFLLSFDSLRETRNTFM